MRKSEQFVEQKQREIPGEIVRRNVKQVIDILSNKGSEHLQVLVNQYVNGEKSQYQFLLPKSKYHWYYTQQVQNADLQCKKQRERKYNNFEQSHTHQASTNFNPPQYNDFQIETQQPLPSQTVLVVGTLQSISVGAMCELIKQLRQNQQPYQSIENQVYEQELTYNLNSQDLNKKIQPILDIIQSIKNPQKTTLSIVETVEKPATNKSDLLRGEFGTERDGSLGAWGGKKYQGLGMRDEFTNYRKQVSKSFYQSIPR